MAIAHLPGTGIYFPAYCKTQLSPLTQKDWVPLFWAELSEGF